MRLAAVKFGVVYSKPNILLTGIQPTGNLHIGNYLGSVTNMLRLQEDDLFSERYLMIADYHSLTTAFTYEHSSVKFNTQIGKDTLEIAKILLASGVDPNKMCLFVQSQVPAHVQLAWIFSCVGPQHWLNTMIQYKQKNHQNSSVGLYTYPILMAADILLYRASHVPVGVDQLQHLQLTNKYGQRFNRQFARDFFAKVKYVQARFPKIMSLVDPLKKMSKSDSVERSRISLSDSQQMIRNKIRRAVTDSEGDSITFDVEKRAGLANLLGIYSAFTNKQIGAVVEECRVNGYNIPRFKDRLVAVVSQRLNEIQRKLQTISDQQVRNLLERGAVRARKAAEHNIKQIKQILNLYC